MKPLQHSVDAINQQAPLGTGLMRLAKIRVQLIFTPSSAMESDTQNRSI